MNKESFKKSLADQGYVLVDFYASWCGPCKTMDNVLDEVIMQFDDLQLIKLDVDKERKLAMAYGVMSLPAIILFDHGQALYQFIGLTSREEIVKKIEELKNGH
ncbi:thioredoxin family protein [Sharpea azabuensis]|uniref:Thioredoxin n=1 Tax=Sharpea porci TaxID=2652286 RepID=A0A844FX51_9FIRM|nr:thioredoxin family protein [Sharpea porci]MDY5279012.1 thioredoxin family protein [Sharpea porci]MST89952.1 thioredoxin family protein [Sharpea porci]